MSVSPIYRSGVTPKGRIILPTNLRTINTIFSRDNLFLTGRRIQKYGGSAHGPDGIRPRDVSVHELGRLSQVLADRIAEGEYRHGPTRPRKHSFPDEHERERFLAIITTILDGGQQGRSRGIDQGSSFSPLALNILRHEIHDRPIDQLVSDGTGQWVRYADDVIYLTRTVNHGQAIRTEAVSKIAEHGLQFKPASNPTINLQARTVEFLGMRLRLVDRTSLQFDVSSRALHFLKQGLSDSRCGPNPGRTAQELLEG